MFRFVWCGLAFLAAAVMQAQPVRLEPDYAQSYIVVRTGRSGIFGGLAGHDHGIVATKWSAELCMDPKNPAAGKVAVTIPAASLQIDTPEARRFASLESSGPGGGDVPKIQKQMLGPENLASDSHPEIRFRSSSVKPAEGQWLVNGELSIRGRAQPVAVPVKVAPRPSGFAFTGKFSAKQSDFGIKPSSVGGGTVKVKDEVSILFDISAIPNGPCK